MAASRNCKTQSALARKSGVGQATIGRILRGETDPQAGTLTFLAEALRIPFKTLAACAAGEKIDRPEADELAMDRVDRALDDLRQQMNNSIDQLRDLVQSQCGYEPPKSPDDGHNSVMRDNRMEGEPLQD